MKTSLLIAAVCLGMIAVAEAQDAKPMKTAPAQPSPSALEAKVRKSWEQFKNKDKAGYAAGLADGYRAVEDDGDGVRDAKAEVAEIDGFDAQPIHAHGLPHHAAGRRLGAGDLHRRVQRHRGWAAGARQDCRRRNLGEARRRLERAVFARYESEMMARRPRLPGSSPPVPLPHLESPA